MKHSTDPFDEGSEQPLTEKEPATEREPVTEKEQALLAMLDEQAVPSRVTHALSDHRRRLMAQLEAGDLDAVDLDGSEDEQALENQPYRGYAVAASILVGLISAALFLVQPSEPQSELTAQVEEQRATESQRSLETPLDAETALMMASLSEEEWALVEDLEFAWWLQEQQTLEADRGNAG